MSFWSSTMPYNKWLSSTESCNFPIWRGQGSVWASPPLLQKPCSTNPSLPQAKETCEQHRGDGSSQSILHHLFTCPCSLHFHGIHTLSWCTCRNPHQQTPISWNILQSLLLFWNTLIAIKYGKHLPKLSINAAKPPKMNLNASCYFNYFSKGPYFYVNACHYSRILYKKIIKLWEGLKS